MNSTLKTTAKSRVYEFLVRKAQAGRNHLHGLLFAATRLGAVSMAVFLVPLCHAMLPQPDMRIDIAGNSVSDTNSYTRTISEPLPLISMSSTSISPDGCSLTRF